MEKFNEAALEETKQMTIVQDIIKNDDISLIESLISVTILCAFASFTDFELSL